MRLAHEESPLKFYPVPNVDTSLSKEFANYSLKKKKKGGMCSFLKAISIFIRQETNQYSLFAI